MKGSGASVAGGGEWESPQTLPGPDSTFSLASGLKQSFCLWEG